jgi:hypothetical protein
MPRVQMELADRANVRRSLPEDSSVIAWRQDEGDARSPDVLGHSRAGYLLDQPGFGLFHISRHGGHVRCAPTRVATWRWQRYLVGRVLPFASALRGFEAWHAAGVVVNGRAIALAGESGTGKSSLVAEMVLNGGRMLADDVLALAAGGAEVISYPGPGLMSLRARTVERLTQAELRKIGVRVGTQKGSVRLAVARQDSPLPLAAVYLLTPTASGPAQLTVLGTPDPRLLLASTFNFALRTPSRLITQLDICAAVARSIRVVRVAVPRAVDYRALGEQVWDDAARVEACDTTEPS